MRIFTRSSISRLPVLVLLGATLLFWSLYERYEPAGPAALTAPDLAEAETVRGEVAQEGDRFRLHVVAQARPALVRFDLPGATDHERVRVRVTAALEGVRVGSRTWCRARVLYIQYDGQNRRIQAKHVVLAEQGNRVRKPVVAVFRNHPEAARAELVLQQLGAAGTAWFSELEVQPVSLRSSFTAWRVLFVLLWVLLALLSFKPCRLNRRRLKTLILLNALVILAGALVPSAWIDSTAVMLKDRLQGGAATRQTQGLEKPAGNTPPARQAPPRERADENQELTTYTHRAGHLALFASLCLLLYLSGLLEQQAPRYYRRATLDVLLFAAVTESLQFLTLDRSANLSDLLVDVAGIALAALLFLAARPLLRRLVDR